MIKEETQVDINLTFSAPGVLSSIDPCGEGLSLSLASVETLVTIPNFPESVTPDALACGDITTFAQYGMINPATWTYSIIEGPFEENCECVILPWLLLNRPHLRLRQKQARHLK